jgi:hypothetical protein
MSGYPSPNVGAGVEFAIVLSGAGISGESGEFSLKASYQSAIVVTASVVDLNDIAVSKQPALTATSTNGGAPSGESSENTAMPQPNGGGSTYPPSETQRAPRTIVYVPGVYPNSNVASVGAVSAGVATVTINNVGQALVEWRTPRGTTARLSVQRIQQS